MIYMILEGDSLRAALPTSVRKSVTDDVVNNLNQLTVDPEFRERYRENLLSYANVMANGKFKIQSYLDAVRYVSYKLMGDTNIKAHQRTFPDKHTHWVSQNVAPKDIASYVTAYNKSKLVNLIYEQTLVPTYVLNQDMFQQALNVQAELMLNANSEKVRSDAANSLLTHLKPPETKKVELDVSVKEDSSIDALRASTMALVAQQREMIKAGMAQAQEIAHSTLVIEGELSDDQ